MQRFVLIVCCLGTVITGFSQRKTDVTGYSYQIKLSDQNDSIHVRCLVSFNCLDTASFIVLDLANLNNKGKGMIVKETRAMNLNGPDLAPYTHTGDKLIVWFPSVLSKGTFGNVYVKYDGI